MIARTLTWWSSEALPIRSDAASNAATNRYRKDRERKTKILANTHTRNTLLIFSLRICTPPTHHSKSTIPIIPLSLLIFSSIKYTPPHFHKHLNIFCDRSCFQLCQHSTDVLCMCTGEKGISSFMTVCVPSSRKKERTHTTHGCTNRQNIHT